MCFIQKKRIEFIIHTSSTIAINGWMEFGRHHGRGVLSMRAFFLFTAGALKMYICFKTLTYLKYEKNILESLLFLSYLNKNKLLREPYNLNTEINMCVCRNHRLWSVLFLWVLISPILPSPLCKYKWFNHFQWVPLTLLMLTWLHVRCLHK